MAKKNLSASIDEKILSDFIIIADKLCINKSLLLEKYLEDFVMKNKELLNGK